MHAILLQKRWEHGLLSLVYQMNWLKELHILLSTEKQDLQQRVWLLCITQVHFALLEHASCVNRQQVVTSTKHTTLVKECRPYSQGNNTSYNLASFLQYRYF